MIAVTGKFTSPDYTLVVVDQNLNWQEVLGWIEKNCDSPIMVVAPSIKEDKNGIYIHLRHHDAMMIKLKFPFES